LYSKYFTKRAPEGFGDFKIEEQVTGTVKYAEYLVLLAREEGVRASCILSWLKWKSRTVDNLQLSVTVIISIYFYLSKSKVSLPHKSAQNITSNVLKITYEGESNENLKSAIKIRNTTRFLVS
jgi:hypothetical protein